VIARLDRETGQRRLDRLRWGDAARPAFQADGLPSIAKREIVSGCAIRSDVFATSFASRR
jgi:hypothetical protein